MNILHTKYALEVAKCGSITKASEKLFVAVPNISRSIKELEKDLGIVIFERYPKGVKLTRDGEIFISHAKDILNQIDHIENLYKDNKFQKNRFSVSLPYSIYTSEAFAEFSVAVSIAKCELIYKENNTATTIKNVFEYEYHLGLIRYSHEYDAYVKKQLEEKNLRFELIAEFPLNILVNKNSPLASLNEVRLDDLSDYTEIVHSDSPLSSNQFPQKKQNNISKSTISVSNGTMQYKILQKNNSAYLFSPPVSQAFLDEHNLVKLNLLSSGTVYKDLLIYGKGYKLTDTDNKFISILKKAQRKHFSSENN